MRASQGAFDTKQLYLPDTAILITRFLTEAGVGEVIDFMPATSSTHATENHRIVRLIRCVRGRMTFDLDIAPRFDYGRRPHEAHLTEHGGIFTSGGSSLTFHIMREPDDVRLVQPRVDAATSMARSRWRLGKGVGWSWRQPPTDRRGRFGWRRPSSSSTAPPGSGVRGRRSPRTPDDGGRCCSDRRSR
jgi:Domain of unknown function (DUF5911)